jgi:hypothetical protein
LKKIIKFYFLLSIIIGQSHQNFSLSLLNDISFSNKDTTFNSSGVELVGMGHMHPNAMIMAYINFPFNDEKFSIEEVYIDFKNKLNIKFGYFRPDIGFINKAHAHTYNFISSPNSMKYLLGNHNWSTLGVAFGYQLPFKWENNFSINILKNTIGDVSHISHNDNHYNVSIQDTINNDLAYSMILKNSFKLNDKLKIKFGTNFTNGREKSNDGLSFQLKNEKNPFNFWVLQFEFMKANIYNYHNGLAYHPNEKLQSQYFLLGRQYNKNFHFGIIVDQWNYELKDILGNSKSIYLSYAPMNDDFVIRVKISDNQTILGNNPYGVIKIIWSLGPHKPQRY